MDFSVMVIAGAVALIINLALLTVILIFLIRLYWNLRRGPYSVQSFLLALSRTL